MDSNKLRFDNAVIQKTHKNYERVLTYFKRMIILTIKYCKSVDKNQYESDILTESNR